MEKPKNELENPTTPQQYLRLLFTGFAMGASDIVPGVSGGTMAFILGVYETLIDGIKSFDATAIRLLLGRKFNTLLHHIPFRFLITLGIGVLLAIVALSGFLSSTMDDPTGRILLFAFFFGLVLASILTIGVKVKWGVIPVVALIVATIVALVIVTTVPAEAPHEPLNLILSGMVAICAMILPGISGAFILLVLGQYDYVLTAVSDRNLPPVIFTGIGAIIGLLLFSRVLSWLLKNYYDATVAALVGFMVGSLWKIYPWKECVVDDLDRHGEFRCLSEQNIIPAIDQTFLIALGLLVIGFLIVNLADHIQTSNNLVFRRFWRRRKLEEELEA